MAATLYEGPNASEVFRRQLDRVDCLLRRADPALAVVVAIMRPAGARPGLADTRTANAAAFAVQHALAQMATVEWGITPCAVLGYSVRQRKRWPSVFTGACSWLQHFVRCLFLADRTCLLPALTDNGGWAVRCSCRTPPAAVEIPS
eukprot:SAG22_NODE_969_length_6231_cov_4.839041_6_plen_146_part_00